MGNPEKRISFLVTIAFLVVYFVSIVWINFNGGLWYQMDVFTYALEGRLMHETRSFFPDGWVFSNQYHIISSPNISALFYGIVKDSTISMAIASTLSSLLILFSFWWCFKPYLEKTTIATGLLCIAGGVIFGRSASSYLSGLQVLHTMASFYGSYMIVLLVSLGCWLRLQQKDSFPIWILVLVLPLNFAMGMQSLREMLILVIPLLIMEAIHFFYHLSKGESFGTTVKRNCSLLFVVSILIVEVAGHFYMASLDITTTPIIGEVDLDLSPKGLVEHVLSSTKNLFRISGIALAKDGLQYLPLSICAMLVALIVIWSLLHIIRIKDDGPLAQAICFALISVMGVYFVGIFMMRTRDIYYFVYWLLATLSIVYFLRHIKVKHVLPCTITFLAIFAVNYGFNFIPDFKDYRQNNQTVVQFSKHLADQGVKVIYLGAASPIFAATSHDRIISQAIWLDATMASGYPLSVFPSDKYLPAFDDQHQKDALICFSNSYLDFIEKATSPFKEVIESSLVPVEELQLGQRKYILYKPTDRVIAPISLDYD